MEIERKYSTKLLLVHAPLNWCWYSLQWKFELEETTAVIESTIVFVLRVGEKEQGSVEELWGRQ